MSLSSALEHESLHESRGKFVDSFYLRSMRDITPVIAKEKSQVAAMSPHDFILDESPMLSEKFSFGMVVKCNNAKYAVKVTHAAEEFSTHHLFLRPLEEYAALCYETLVRRAQVLATLPVHPNLVPILHTFTAELPDSFLALLPQGDRPKFSHPKRCLFTVMPCYATTLRHLLETTAVPLTTALGWCLDIGAALLHLQQHRFVHRDLKSNNVVITEDHTAVLIDFGVVLQCDSPEAPEAPSAEVPLLGRIDLDGELKPGGAMNRLAPEVVEEYLRKAAVYPGRLENWRRDQSLGFDPEARVYIDYSHQPSFEFGMLRKLLPSVFTVRLDMLRDIVWQARVRGVLSGQHGGGHHHTQLRG
jgi:serine/threonine protein kinase